MNIASALVTGTTGFLGSHFLVNFLGKKVDHAFVVIRGADVATCRQRIEAALTVAANSYVGTADVEYLLSRVTVLPGDISVPNLGLDVSALQMLRAANVHSVWHFAASLSFEDYKREHIHSANVDGTSNTIDLAVSIAAHHFVYVSTAYTAGVQEGHVAEDYHRSRPGFSNFYEESKWEAESLLRVKCADIGLPLTMLRPSVVIGTSQTKRPGGTASGLYGFIRELSRLRKPLAASKSITRLFGKPEGEVNFIPIDALMQQVAQVIDRGLKDGDVHHLTSDGNPTTRRAIEIICECLGVRNLAFCRQEDDDLSPLETLLAKKTLFYRSYLNSHKQFERRLGARVVLDETSFRGYVLEGIKDMSNAQQQHFRRRRVIASDGALLNAFSAGEASQPAVLIINAVGMPVEFTRPLSECLSKNFHVLGWESRTLPSAGIDDLDRSVSIERHVQDAVEILDTFGVPDALIVGWCTGARVALRLVTLSPDKARGVVLLNGGYNLADCERTVFESNMDLVMPRMAKDRRYADLFHQAIFSRKADAATGDSADARRSSNSLLSSTDPDLVHLTSLPFHNPDHLYRYSRLVAAFVQEPIQPTDLALSNVPLLIVTGDEDVTTHPTSTRLIAQSLGAEAVVFSGADHFALYKQPPCIDMVAQFAARHRRRTAVENLIL